MRTNPESACQYFGAGAILHNIAIMLNDPPFLGGNDGNNAYKIAQYAGPQHHRGSVVRDYIANAYF